MDIINVGLISLGCSKNQVDAERMLALLRDSGYNISGNLNCCEVVIINTCGFIEAAKQESIDEILNIAQFKSTKKNNHLKLIVVTGCLAERYKNMLKEQIPEIDIVVGIGGNKDIAKLISDGLIGKCKTYFPSKNEIFNCGDRILTTPKYMAYLKIADGCDNRCTYCAIPLIRGSYVSIPKEIIIKEAKKLVREGVKEINIVAQDVTYYGKDLYNKLALGELLRELCKIEKIKWIRLLYCYPDKITDELIEVIANNKKIVKYIDIPFQHVNNEILKKMNRVGDKKLILEVIERIREKIPDIVIRSTFIVGFPGETEEQFCELLEFIREAKLARVGCFKYSQEEGTPAAKFNGQVDEKVKNERYERLMTVQDEVLENFNRAQKGKSIEVLVEGFDQDNNLFYGRSYMEAPDIDGYIDFDLENNYQGQLPKPGDFVNIIL